MAFAIAFTRLGGATTGAFQVGHTDNEDEDRADDAKPRRSVDIGLEERGRDDVLDLRRTGQESIVKVKAPSAMVPGIRRLGMLP
jgi:hypothetical protein